MVFTMEGNLSDLYSIFRGDLMCHNSREVQASKNVAQDSENPCETHFIFTRSVRPSTA